MSVKQTLETARQLVAGGWVQESYQRGDCFCTVGAINKAAGLQPHGAIFQHGTDKELAFTTQELFARANNLLPDGRDPEPELLEGYIAQWNDMDSTTWQDVLVAFWRALEYCK